MGYIRNTSSIIPGWDIKRNSADMKELSEIAPPFKMKDSRHPWRQKNK